MSLAYIFYGGLEERIKRDKVLVERDKGWRST